MESGAVELSVGRLRMGDIARDGTRVHVNPACRTSRASPGVGMECAYPGVLAPRDLSPAERLSRRTTWPMRPAGRGQSRTAVSIRQHVAVTTGCQIA